MGFTTNYSMAAARRDWLAGTAPGQHLWGTPHLEAAGWTVRLLPTAESSASGRVAAAWRSRAGHLPAQRAALGGPHSEVLYTADRGSFAGLALLAALGLTRRDLVTVIHPSVIVGGVRGRSLRGHRVAIAISQVVHQDLLAAGRTAADTVYLPWGPDLAFPGYGASHDDGVVVSSGKTLRDLPTLLAALDGVDAPSVVHLAGPAVRPAPPQGQLRVRVPYREVLADLQRAAVVAIPLSAEAGTVGLTELNDALALGKPVVMTRNRYLDVDLVGLGIGIVVEPGDVRGWRDALLLLMNDPARRADMGARARAFAESSWNADRFGRGLVEIFDRL